MGGFCFCVRESLLQAIHSRSRRQMRPRRGGDRGPALRSIPAVTQKNAPPLPNHANHANHANHDGAIAAESIGIVSIWAATRLRRLQMEVVEAAQHRLATHHRSPPRSTGRKKASPITEFR